VITASFFFPFHGRDGEIRISKRPEPVTMSWAEMVNLMIDSFAQPAEASEKKTVPAVSFARYREGAFRSNEAALDADWIALDMDGKADDAWTYDQAERHCRSLSVPFFIHTTTGSREGADRFRIMFPLSRPVPADEFPAFWQAMNRMFADQVDNQTCDVSRMCFLPRTWAGANNRYDASKEGDPLDVDHVLRLYAKPFIEPHSREAEAFVKHVNEYRIGAKYGLGSNVDFSRMYDLDRSPIVPPAALEEALSSPAGGRTIALMCSIALSALSQLYEVTIGDLVELGRAFSHRVGRDFKESELQRDAARALAFARQEYRPVHLPGSGGKSILGRW